MSLPENIGEEKKYTRFDLLFYMEEEMLKNKDLDYSFVSAIRKSAETDDVSFNLMEDYLKETSPFNQAVVLKKLKIYLKNTGQYES